MNLESKGGTEDGRSELDWAAFGTYTPLKKPDADTLSDQLDELFDEPSVPIRPAAPDDRVCPLARARALQCTPNKSRSTLTSEERRELQKKGWTKETRFGVKDLTPQCIKSFQEGDVKDMIIKMQHPLLRDFGDVRSFFELLCRVASICTQKCSLVSDQVFLQNLTASLQMNSGSPVFLTAETFLLLFVNPKHSVGSLNLLWSRVPVQRQAAVAALIFSGAPGLSDRPKPAGHVRVKPTVPGLISTLVCELLATHGNVFQYDCIRRTFGSHISKIDLALSPPHLCKLKSWTQGSFPSSRLPVCSVPRIEAKIAEVAVEAKVEAGHVESSGCCPVHGEGSWDPFEPSCPASGVMNHNAPQENKHAAASTHQPQQSLITSVPPNLFTQVPPPVPPPLLQENWIFPPVPPPPPQQNLTAQQVRPPQQTVIVPQVPPPQQQNVSVPQAPLQQQTHIPVEHKVTSAKADTLVLVYNCQLDLHTDRFILAVYNAVVTSGLYREVEIVAATPFQLKYPLPSRPRTDYVFLVLHTSATRFCQGEFQSIRDDFVPGTARGDRGRRWSDVLIR
mgnify:CR=1 FL=1